MKRSIIILLFSVFSIAGYTETKPTQNVDFSAVVKTQAQAMVKHLQQKEYRAFVGYMYPKVVEMLGGELKLVNTLQRDGGQLNIVNVTFGNPSKVIKAGSELQCTIPQTLVMKTDNGNVTSKSTLIAISKDNGKHWYFLDTSGKPISELRKSLPNLSKDLVVPSR